MTTLPDARRRLDRLRQQINAELGARLLELLKRRRRHDPLPVAWRQLAMLRDHVDVELGRVLQVLVALEREGGHR